MADSPEIPDEFEPRETIAIPDVLPVMALKDAVLFPVGYERIFAKCLISSIYYKIF